MTQHYQTEYSDKPGFQPKLEKNTDIILEEVIPELKAQGFGFSANCIDEVAFELSDEQRKHWIEPMPRWSGIRPPDLKSEGNKFIVIQGTDTKSVLFEFKDFPQENNFLMTGIPYRNVRTYLAIQHLWEIPIFCLFRDNAKQEAGGGPMNLTPYQSAFKENGKYLLYGDLLMDMYLSLKYSYKDQANKKIEIRWTCQRERDGTEPVMKPISAITQMLKDGRIKKVRADPTELGLWKLIQKKSDEMNEPRLIVPEGGLVYFTTR